MGTRQDVECLLKVEEEEEDGNTKKENESLVATPCLAEWLWEGAVLVSPFFFWGTAMVAMKEVLPKCGVIFVAAFRLIPAGFLLVGIALVDAACFQGFLTEGLQRTLAGLGSPLTVAVLAALLFRESIGIVGAVGLVLGVIGLVLLELPALSFDESNFSLWGSGEWWMLLAAQSMAVGTVMGRWAFKYSDLWTTPHLRNKVLIVMVRQGKSSPSLLHL